MIYTVIWKYDVHADSPIEAINIANADMIEYHEDGWVYDVEDEGGNFIMSGVAEIDCEGDE
jgi:hypothetical protein